MYDYDRRRTLASLRSAIEFATPEAMKKYLEEHPDADAKAHSVKKPSRKRPVRPVKEFGHWAKEDVAQYDVPADAKREILQLSKTLDSLEKKRQKLNADDEHNVQQEMTRNWEKLKKLYTEHIGFDPQYPGFW